MSGPRSSRYGVGISSRSVGVMASGEEPIYSALAKAASTWAGLGRDMGGPWGHGDAHGGSNGSMSARVRLRNPNVKAFTINLR